MEKIKELILNNYELNNEEIILLDDILNSNKLNYDKIFSVIQNLIKFRLDYDTILAYISFEQKFDIKGRVNKDTQEIYDSLKNDFSITSAMTLTEQAENLRKMFIAMNKDLRVIVVKLYVMLYEVSCYSLPLSQEQHRNLINIREIYAPLAERIGLNSLKSNLEDYCLKFLNPKTYDNLAKSVMLQHDENQKQIEITTKRLQTILDELGLKDATITSRQKHFSSIYKKIQAKGVSLANIYDLIAERVLVDTIEDCYAVLGKIHGIYRPMEGRFKDYIANPKKNGYQSLHTTVIVENNRPLEIQIRTYEMHKMAEYGIFAHYLYKEKRTKMTSLDKKITWLREIIESSNDLSAEQFIETLKTNLCEGQIYVQTPKGKVLEFVEGATVLDFAYNIHTDIGNSCVGAKVNGQIKPLSTKMKNGDIVEIITSQNSKGPSKDWLKFVKTESAKSKINAYFKHNLREENIKLGQNMLEQAIKNKGYVPNKLLIDKYLDVTQFKYAFNTIDELFAAIGYGSVPVNNICNRICQLYEDDHKQDMAAQNIPAVTNTLTVKKNKDGVLIDGDSGMLIRYAGCCTPVYGEGITGYISRGRGVTIHCSNCKNLKYLEHDRLINAVWDDNVENRKSSIIVKIISNKSDSFLISLTTEMVSGGYKILGLDSKETSNGKVNTILKVEIATQTDVDKVINILKDIKGVEDVFRVGR